MADRSVRPEAGRPGLQYGQCWEDADVLLRALDVQPGQTCLSIASGGDNTLALLSRAPGRVIALDRNPAQLAALELRVAAYRALDHRGLLELLGSRRSRRRPAHYDRCRPLLSPAARAFWDDRPEAIAGGIAGAGRLERFLARFRTVALPLVHSPRRTARLLHGGPRPERERFYREEWDTWRWRLCFRTCFSRLVLGRGPRSPGAFAHVRGPVASRLLARVGRALVDLDPADNPYLRWILTGRHGRVLPCALRPAAFEPIRARLDRLEWHPSSLEDFLTGLPARTIDRFNLSDVFEYLAPADADRVLAELVRAARPGARLAYWTLLAPRPRPQGLAGTLRPLAALAEALHREDRAFFYRELVVEEVPGP